MPWDSRSNKDRMYESSVSCVANISQRFLEGVAHGYVDLRDAEDPDFGRPTQLKSGTDQQAQR